MSKDRYKKNRMDLSHEIWAAAQLTHGEGIADGVARIETLLRRAIHSAITHCDNCGCSWLDDGLNPIGCPYCEHVDWRAVNAELLPLPVGEDSSFGNYEVHDNEAMVAYARANVARAVAPLQAEIEALRAEVERLRADLMESDEIREKIGHLLTRTAAALKGEPPDGVWHSWHDLPEKVTQLTESLRRLEERVQREGAA